MGIKHLIYSADYHETGIVSGIGSVFPKSVDSTNTLAADLFRGTPLLIATENQTAGRGTRGRSFCCSEGKGLYFSLAVYESFFSDDMINIITPAVSVAVATALNSLYDLNVKIKWVNDIVINDKKLCGILCERKLYEGRAFIIIGIGINYSNDFLPDEIKERTVGLSDYSDNIDSFELLSKTVGDILDLNNENCSHITNEYKSFSSILGRKVYYSVSDKVKVVTAVDYDSNCNLIISDKDETRIINCGDISIKPLN